MQWQFGARTNSFDIGWTEPWFLDKPMSLGIDIFNTTRVQQLGTITNDYTTRDRGGSITLGPRFSDIYTLSFGYALSSQLRYNVAPTRLRAAPSFRRLAPPTRTAMNSTPSIPI